VSRSGVLSEPSTVVTVNSQRWKALSGVRDQTSPSVHRKSPDKVNTKHATASMALAMRPAHSFRAGHDRHRNGHLSSRGFITGRYRRFNEQHVRWLRNQQTLAARVPSATAVLALREESSVAERAAVDRQLDRLCGNVREARQQLTPSEDVEQLPAEQPHVTRIRCLLDADQDGVFGNRSRSFPRPCDCCCQPMT